MKRRNRVAVFNIMSTVLLNGISIITGPLFSQMLGTSGFGVLKIYNIWASVAAILFTLQTQGTLVNARVEYPEEEQNRYQSSVMAMSVLMFLLCSAVVGAFLEPISRLLKLQPLLIGLMLLQAFGPIYRFRLSKNL